VGTLPSEEEILNKWQIRKQTTAKYVFVFKDDIFFFSINGPMNFMRWAVVD
jgi:hypothetical protein